MGKLLWHPSEERIKSANITKFINFVNNKFNVRIKSYFELYNWSIENIINFWAAIWEFGEIRYSRGYDFVVDNLNKFPGACWFGGARLNFAENLLRFTDEQVAFSFKGEDRKSSKMTYAELYDQVARLAYSLRKMSIKPGDRVCAYFPNLIETAVAMLASTSVGAIWASCGAELGPQAVKDRLGQIEPKVLFTVDGYWYKGRIFNLLTNVKKIAEEIPSLEKVVIYPYIEDEHDIGDIEKSVYFDEFLSSETRLDIRFEQLPFEHPVYLMFSSGTTGRPKCMVQGTGVLLNHLKELILHTDLKRKDVITYLTSPSWMMWNWLMSSLAVGASIVLYDGNPNYPDPYAMWKLIQDEKITIFGCSASFINYLQRIGVTLGQKYNLSSLREISQTGSPLSAEGFEWIYREVKEDLHFNSISGGTDINGCFAIGNPSLPVYAGELQAPALGVKMKAYDEEGNSIIDEEGELVCEAPFPSMPLYFWNDPENRRYEETYFNFYKNIGKHVWRHGDWIIVHSDTGGITFLGRSDAVLKPSGVRIGTAEIYNIVESLEGIADSLAVGQNWRGDQRIILFIKLFPGHDLTEDLKNRIRKALRNEASPRHIPALILETPDIPYTFNMKKVEIAVSNIIEGRPITNRGALTNPESLDYFEKILPELQRDR